MGEKIRDIHPIKIGKTSLMIELNEGYSASQGRVIHIQNKKYRYLLKEKDFYHLCSMVMRAWSEFVYIKNNIKIGNKTLQKREEISDNTKILLNNLLRMDTVEQLNYRLLDIQNNLITLLVKDVDLESLSKILSSIGFAKKKHPMGVEKGYKFLYQMVPFQLYQKDGINIEIFCQLPCASLTPKTWIPLDRLIQKRLWENTCILNNINRCDILCLYIYHLCWAIFYHKGFSPFEREFLHENMSCLDSSEIKDLLKVVFFNYTDRLICLLKNEDYEKIVYDYYTYVEY